MSATAALLRRPAGPVLADMFAGTWVRTAIMVFAGAMLTALAAQIAIPVPGSPVPITGQTLAVVLVGSTLGAQRGALSLVLYLALGLMFPFYSDAGSGPEVLFGTNGGYLFGFVLAAYVIGWLSERGADRQLAVAFVSFVAAQLIVFGLGLPWLKIAADLGWSGTISAGFTPFIVGGLIKAAIAAAAMPSAWKLARWIKQGDDKGAKKH